MTTSFGDALPDLPAAASTVKVAAAGMAGAVLRIPVSIQVVIGSALIPLSQVALLGPGSVITLDQKLGAPALILVNGREIARGELFVLEGEGNGLGISITEVADFQSSRDA